MLARSTLFGDAVNIGKIVVNIGDHQVILFDRDDEDVEIKKLFNLANSSSCIVLNLPQNQKAAELLGQLVYTSPKTKSTEVSIQTIERLSRKLEEFHFSVRTKKLFEQLKLVFIWEVAQKTEQDLLRMNNFGRGSLNEVKSVLGTLNLSVGMSIDPAIRQFLPEETD